MKSSEERIQSINNKVKNKRKQRTVIWSAVTACVLAAFILVCSLPILGENAPPINAHKNNQYYPIIEKINAKYEGDKTSIFGQLGETLEGLVSGNQAAAPEAPSDSAAPTSPGASSSDPSDNSNKYEETTLNQVDGVIEADLLKRSSTHAFYVTGGYIVNSGEHCLELKVYRLAGAQTERVNDYYIRAKDDTSFTPWYSSSIYKAEMFLNADATRLTVVTSCRSSQNIGYTVIISLDVSDVNNITEVNRVYMSGRYLSSRMVDGKLLVITNFYVGRYGNYYGTTDVDYSKQETYVPQCGSALASDFIPMDSIYVPDKCPSIDYTVLAMLDEATLEVKDSYAVFAYSQDVYVSRDYIVVVRNNSYVYRNQFNYGHELSAVGSEPSKSVVKAQVCEMVAIKYGDGFEKKGEIGVDGYVKDRYSLDEKDDVLRVFVTTIHTKASDNWWSLNTINVSLYCIDLNTLQFIASKEQFAPSGDEVKSVRFDGDKAYVCTARRNMDPVFYFDLSDLNNITYVDTGEIDGFSFNLIKFNDMLLGIGQGASDRWSVKIELYKESDDAESENGVVSVDKYERLGQCSQEYKAHFVDAEHNLIGLQIYDYEDEYIMNKPAQQNKYLLLRYDAESGKLQIVYFEQLQSVFDEARAFYKDNGVYVFGTSDFKFVDLND